jgi:hypothetical protein
MKQEDAESYYEAFRLAFQAAEFDIDRRLPWAHLLSEANPPKSSAHSPTTGIKKQKASYFFMG